MAWTDSCKFDAVAQIKKRAEGGGCLGLYCAFVLVGKEMNVPTKTLRQWYADHIRGPYKMDAASVYFVQAGNGLIKIGMSLNVNSRIKALQQASPLKLSLLKTIDGGRKMEASLHKTFKHLRSHGEWFFPQQDLITFIGKACVYGNRQEQTPRGLQDRNSQPN